MKEGVEELANVLAIYGMCHDVLLLARNFYLNRSLNWLLQALWNLCRIASLPKQKADRGGNNGSNESIQNIHQFIGQPSEFGLHSGTDDAF